MRKIYSTFIKNLKLKVFGLTSLFAGLTVAQPTFTITNPNGGQNYTANTTQTISWNVSIPVMMVSLELSINNGSSWTSIGTAPGSTATSGSFTWSVPNTASNLCLVRAYSGSTVGVGVSANVFTITGVSNINLTAPNNVNWTVGSTQTITWLNSAPLSTVNIDYSINNGTTWSVVATNQSAGGSLGSYSWIIPNTVSTNCRVRINAGGVNTSTTASTFTISTPPSSIAIASPNGGQNWMVGSTQNITWLNSTLLSTVNIDYSINNGTTWSVVATNQPAGGTSGSYAWTIPNTISGSCLVRLNAGGANTSTSAATFSISAAVSQLTVTAPNGGENWVANSTQVITWMQSAPISTVSIEYSINNGVTYSTVIGSTPSGVGGGSFNWTIPNTVSNQCLVRVNGGGANVDVSNGTFTISPPVSQLTVTAPNGGENWVVGTTQVITWNTAGPITTVSIEYSTNNGSTYSTIIASTANGVSGGSFNWTIPNTVSNQCLVRVNGGGANVDVSNATFNITAALSLLNVTAPNGGENWTVGSTQNITWSTTAPITTVSIEYSTNNGLTYSLITASAPSNVGGGSYAWIVPNTPTNTCKVRVNGGGANVDESNAVFNILAPVSQLTVTAPNGGENWVVGSTQLITWASAGPITTVSIEYSTNNGSTYSSIIANTPNGVSGGSFNWTIPNTVSNQCLVRVNGGGANVDASNGTFTISAAVSQLTVTSPNGGESWMETTTQVITWNTSGPITTVSIEYSTDNGSTYSTVIASTPNGVTGGSYNWTIPSTISNQCLVRVNGGGANMDVSNGAFTISSITGLKNNLAAASVQVYPNPFKSNLYVSVNEASTLTMLDATGKVVFKGQVLQNKTIDFSDLAQGVYFISVTNPSGSLVKKLIKE